MFSSVSVPTELSNQRFDKVVAELTPDLSRSKIKQLIFAWQSFVEWGSYSSKTKS